MRKNQAAQDFLALIPGLSTQIHTLSTVIHNDVEKVVDNCGQPADKGVDNPKEARVYFGCENAQKDRYGQGFWGTQKKNGNAVCGVERPKVDKSPPQPFTGQHSGKLA